MENKVCCPWCTSRRLEPRSSGDETRRLYVCLECGTTTRATISVNIRSLLGLCKQNKKITAIKLHRVCTGVGLKEAKDFIEQLMIYM